MSGGFAESEHLFAKVGDWAHTNSIKVTRAKDW
jgi:hypothetical protein